MYENNPDRIAYLKDTVLPKLKILYYLTCDSEHMFDVIRLYANNNTMTEGNSIEEFKKIYNFIDVFNTISNSELNSFIDFIMPYRSYIFKEDQLSMINNVLSSPLLTNSYESDDFVDHREFFEQRSEQLVEQAASLHTELDITSFDGDIMIT